MVENAGCRDPAVWDWAPDSPAALKRSAQLLNPPIMSDEGG